MSRGITLPICLGLLARRHEFLLRQRGNCDFFRTQWKRLQYSTFTAQQSNLQPHLEDFCWERHALKQWEFFLIWCCLFIAFYFYLVSSVKLALDSSHLALNSHLLVDGEVFQKSKTWFPAKTIWLDIYVDGVNELKRRFRGYFFQVTIFGFVFGMTLWHRSPICAFGSRSDIHASERWLQFERAVGKTALPSMDREKSRPSWGGTCSVSRKPPLEVSCGTLALSSHCCY